MLRFFFFSKVHESKRERLVLQDSTGLTPVLRNLQALDVGNSASLYSQPNLIKPDNKRWKLESYSGEIKMWENNMWPQRCRETQYSLGQIFQTSRERAGGNLREALSKKAHPSSRALKTGFSPSPLVFRGFQRHWTHTRPLSQPSCSWGRRGQPRTCSNKK